MVSKPDNTAGHEMSTRDPGRFNCVCIANVRSVTTARSGENQSAIWHRGDCERKESDPTFCKTGACRSAKVTGCISRETQAFACVRGAFSPLLPGIYQVKALMDRAELDGIFWHRRMGE